MLHVNTIIFLVDIKTKHVNIMMLHVDINYLACRVQKYATVELFTENIEIVNNI